MSWFKKKKKPNPGHIPFSMNKGVPIITVELNGKKAKFLIDTGASLNIVSSEVAKKYDFKTYEPRSKTMVSGIGGSEVMLAVSDANVLFEGTKIRIPFKSVSLKNVRHKLGIVGIIGSRWLNEHSFLIDYCLNTVHKVED